MRIGFFTETFLPQQNGVVTSMLNYGNELVRRGHEVCVFCPGHKGQKHGTDENNFKVFRYPSFSFPPYPEYRVALPHGEVPKLDIVHTHGPFMMGQFGLKVAEKQKIPKISTYHTLLSEYAKKYLALATPLAWAYQRRHYNRYDKLTTPSLAIKKILAEHGINGKIEVVPNSVDAAFRPLGKEKARKRLMLDSDEKIFLSLGRLGFEKNVDVIIKAMESVDGKLLVVGKGPASEKLKSLANQRKLNAKVRFAGFVEKSLLPHYYSAADAFVIASTTETQGVVCLEAMACGCPVIGADATAIPEAVENGRNGFLFEAGNINELTCLLNSFKPSKKLSKNAIKESKKYSVEKCTDKLEKVYESLV